jgi:putative Mn2+ efflux pump MntP
MTKKYRVFREIGKVAVNFGSLTFASLVLGTIIRGDYDKMLVLLGGFGGSIVLIVYGIICLTAGGEEK